MIDTSRAVLAALALCATAVCLNAQQPARVTTQQGVFSTEQADAGAALYTETCSKCHGAALSGSDMVPPLKGSTFAASWNGASLTELYDRIRVSMPADAPATLDADQIRNAIAFILRANGTPSGSAELPRDPQALARIRIDGLK